MNWSHLEQATAVALWVAAGVKVGQGRLLTNGVPTLIQWDQIATRLSAPSFQPELLSWFKEWRKRAEALRLRRNDAIHSMWGATGDSDYPHIALDALSRRARGVVREDVVPGGAASLRGLANEIGTATLHLVDWTANTMGPGAPERGTSGG